MPFMLGRPVRLSLFLDVIGVIPDQFRCPIELLLIQLKKAHQESRE
jgi:hypothetical protein